MDQHPPSAPRGRAAGSNPANRFTRLSVESEEPPPGCVPTLYLEDTSRSILTTNDSPDVPFDVSLNPYRGCEHGCVYCYARPTHEYLGFSAGLDFESRILVKRDAARLLEAELASPRWRPQTIGISGVTDPYQPIERKLGIVRACLEVLADTRNPVAIVTKNHLVTRDADLLATLAEHGAVSVYLSVTSLDPETSRRLEPRAPHPRERLGAVAELTARGIPCGVLIAPVVPAITDHEIPAIVAAAAEAGARSAGFIPLRLPGAVAGLFEEWLERWFPDRKDKVLNRQLSLRGGKLNDSRFGHRMRGQGIFAEQMKALFETACRRHGLVKRGAPLSTAAFRRPSGGQGRLF
ncbi:MAG TPA: PA0069 family radical SAM protein [Thermoanaerobaculia bacterium]|nr:PA0069 family radical SAM protein [Thermoanaerobaculia bacterium]